MYLQRRNRILTPSARHSCYGGRNHFTPNDFIVPLFIVEGEDIKEEIISMSRLLPAQH